MKLSGGHYLAVGPEAARHRRSSLLTCRSASPRFGPALRDKHWFPPFLRQLLAGCEMPQRGVVVAERVP
jgi:hypothetical protein